MEAFGRKVPRHTQKVHPLPRFVPAASHHEAWAFPGVVGVVPVSTCPGCCSPRSCSRYSLNAPRRAPAQRPRPSHRREDASTTTTTRTTGSTSTRTPSSSSPTRRKRSTRLRRRGKSRSRWTSAAGGASGMRSPRSRSGARSRTRWGWTCSATRDGRPRRRVEKLHARARVGRARAPRVPTPSA